MKRSYKNQELMDAAMDATVDNILYKMRLTKYFNPQKEIIHRFAGVGCKELYYSGLESIRIESELKLFEKESQDHHVIWSRENKYHMCMNVEINPGNEVEVEKNMKATQELWKNLSNLVTGGRDSEAFFISYKQNSIGEWGSDAGNIGNEVEASKENQMSYAEILQEFFHEKEGFLEQEGSIDKMLYTFGLDMYEDVALVEPEELTDIQQLHTIVIAIDTSGSCAGKIMERFIRETKNVLRDITCQGDFENIILMQCDSELQDEKRFKEVSEIPDFHHMNTVGYGGTDFKPVFERVEKLQNEENMEIDCLLYLSDGEGYYPQKKPKYPVFFVLPQEKNEDFSVNWINYISLHMSESECY